MDCGSFLAEYLPTGGPIQSLVSDRSVGFNAVGEALADGYYRAATCDDPLEPSRRARTELLFPSGGRAAERLVGHLKESFGSPEARRPTCAIDAATTSVGVRSGSIV